MSAITISEVRRLDNAVNYVLQDHKTASHLISTFACDQDFVVEDFQLYYDERKEALRKETNNKAKFIVQSFEAELDNVTPEEAHQYGIEFAEKYLEGKHQYLVVTHTDTDHIHNHIIFNQVRMDNLLMYDTSRENTINNLRSTNDEISKKHDLYIPKKIYQGKYLNNREIILRQRGKSFKEQLEIVIDEAIKESKTYEEFLQKMNSKGYKAKEGKHLAFNNPKTNKNMRSKTLGVNYNENSIRYRIENKDFELPKYQYTYSITSKMIDKSEAKFTNNIGLRRWASKQNILHLQEISNLAFNKKISLEEINRIQRTDKELDEKIQKQIDSLDDTIYRLKKMESCFQDYKDSYPLMVGYKKAEDKAQYKKDHYSGFKKYDIAKKNMYLLKRDFNITTKEELEKALLTKSSERNNVYSNFINIKKRMEEERQNRYKRRDPSR